MSSEPEPVKLYVSDTSQAKRFYVEVLGLADMPDRSEPLLFYALDAGQYVLTLQDATAAQVDPGTRQGGELEFAVDSLEGGAQRGGDVGREGRTDPADGGAERVRGRGPGRV